MPLPMPLNPLGYAKTGRLPSGYREVEYLRSDGTQWMPLGVYWSSATQLFSLSIRVRYTSQSHGQFMGGYSNNRSIRVDANGRYGTNAGYSTTVASTASFDDVTLSFRSSRTRIGVNGVEVFTTDTTAGSSSARQCSLFMLSDSAGTGPYNTSVCVCDIAAASWVSGGTTLDLVPCVRTSDGRAGMYDLVGGGFYVNQSGGADFTVGPYV